MKVNLQKTVTGYILNIGANKIQIKTAYLLDKEGYLFHSYDGKITYDDNSITLSCKAFTTTLDVGIESISNLKEQLIELRKNEVLKYIRVLINYPSNPKHNRILSFPYRDCDNILELKKKIAQKISNDDLYIKISSITKDGECFFIDPCNMVYEIAHCDALTATVETSKYSKYFV